MRPLDFVKKVGKGKTLSQHLTAEESREAFEALLDGRFTAAQAGAFLQALRIKELSQDELDALAHVFRKRTSLLAPLSGEKTLVLNLASDTARKGGLVSLLAAHLLRRFGVGVGLIQSTPVLSGNRMSFDTSWSLAPILDQTETMGMGSSAVVPKVVDTGSLVMGLSSLDALRGELGFRSCLHTAEKLVNPWPSSPMLLGISHQHYAFRLAGTMASLGQEGWIILGNHGTVDLVLHKETAIVTMQANQVQEGKTVPAELGLDLSPDIYTLANFPHWEAWLETPRDKRVMRAVHYQLAVFLWAAGVAKDARAGLTLSCQALPNLFGED